MALISSVFHINPHAATIETVVAIDGHAVALPNVAGVTLQEEQLKGPKLVTFVPSDSEGMYGRQCPKCKSYFRTGMLATRFCPYCDAAASPLKFLTSYQREFIATEYEAILKAPDDAETRVNLDAKIATPEISDPWVYAEEKQQTHFQCASCQLESDVLGEYVRCPGCGTRTARSVIDRKLEAYMADFDRDVDAIPKTERETRQRQWRSYVASCVAEFEALGRDVAAALARHPLTPTRRKALLALSFQNLIGAAKNLADWYGFDILEGLTEEDKTFLHRMFNRRHLFIHSGGRVDEEYLARTGDQTVRLHEVVRVESQQVQRLLRLVRHVATNLLDGFQSLS